MIIFLLLFSLVQLNGFTLRSQSLRYDTFSPSWKNGIVEGSENGVKWIESSENMILYPSSHPKAVIHFLGGSFLGYSPHRFYNYFLKSLAQSGYIVVATPYRLQMDHVKICDEITQRFDAIASELAGRFGPLVVIGVGHSLGAVLQSLITSLFPETPRALNILISYCSRSVSESIPLFNEVILPSSKQFDRFQSSACLFNVNHLRQRYDCVVDSILTEKQLSTACDESTRFVQQFPDILTEIANGQEEFIPLSAEVREICRRMYRARRTAVIKFSDDFLDDSEDIFMTLKEANTIMRMKRPMVEMEVHKFSLEGTHLTPLAVDLNQEKTVLLPPMMLSSLPASSSKSCWRKSFPSLATVANEPRNLNALTKQICEFLDRYVLPPP